MLKSVGNATFKHHSEIGGKAPAWSLIPRDQNIISTVAVGVLTSAQQPQLAENSLDFVACDEAAAILKTRHSTTTTSSVTRGVACDRVIADHKAREGPV